MSESPRVTRTYVTRTTVTLDLEEWAKANGLDESDALADLDDYVINALSGDVDVLPMVSECSSLVVSLTFAEVSA